MVKKSVATIMAGLFFLISGCGEPKTGSSMVSILTDTELESVIRKSGDSLIAFDLYAEWCAPCRVLTPVLEKIASENKKSVTFYRVNVDQVTQAGQTFQVRGIPMVVFMKNGQIVSTLTGLQSKENYEKAVRENSRR